MWRWLRDRRFAWYKFRRQHPVGPYILDFFCLEASLDIELDGSQHGLQSQHQKDIERDAYLKVHGIQVLRFWNPRLRRNREAVCETIWRALQERAPRSMANQNDRTDPDKHRGRENERSRH
jgi:very-short-patch-repair endonuclease